MRAVKPLNSEKFYPPEGGVPTVFRRAAVIAVFDLLALAFLYLVLGDLSWRTSYVESERLIPHTTYLLFIRTFSITGNTILIPNGLVSPPTLDWVQVVFASLIVVNGLFVFSTLRKSRPV